MIYYTLNDDGTIETCTRDEWAMNYPRWHEKTRVNGVLVSTVFLGLDHNYNSEGPPVLFETMTFTKRRQSSKKFDQLQWRYCEKAAAERTHERIVKTLKHKQNL